MRRWLLFGLCWPVLAGAATDPLHQLLVHEQYAQARQAGLGELDSAKGDAGGELAALGDLIDVGIASREISVQQDYADWARQVVALEGQAGAGHRQILAEAYAVLALQERRGDAQRRAGFLAKSLALIEGVASGPERSFVLQAAATLAGDESHFDRATDAFAQARAALARPRDDWQRLRLGVLEVLYGSYGERSGRADALALAEHGTAAIRAVSGDASLNHGFALTYLAQVRYFGGDYLGAARDADAALQRLADHPERTADRGAALAISANALRTLGNYDAAGAAYDESIRLAQKDSPAVLAGRLNGAAMLELLRGHPVQARASFERALKLIADPDNNRHAIPLRGNLGALAIEAGELDAAEAYLRGAFALSERIYGPRQQSTLEQRSSLALLALRRGQPGEAARSLAEITQWQAETYGDDFPPRQPARCAQALALARSGDAPGAWTQAYAAEQQRLSLLRRVLPVLGGAQALAFKRSLRDCSGLIVGLALRTDSAERRLAAWQLLANGRAIATYWQAQRLALVRAAAGARGQAPWQRWQAASQAYADALLFNTGADSKALIAAQQALAAAEAALGESARTALANLTPEFDLATTLEATGAGHATAAFFEAGVFDLDADARQLWPERRHYFAFVRTPQSAELRLLDLGDAQERNAQIARWERAIRSPEVTSQELAQAGEVVKATIWTPLQLPSDARLAWIPDGEIFRLNPLALPDGDGYLEERGLVAAVLDGERDLQDPMPPAPAAALLLVGAPDYGATPLRCRAGLADLPGAAAELRAARSAWGERGAVTLAGKAVGKNEIRRAIGHADALHIATHLVELDAACPPPSTAARGARVVVDENPLEDVGHQVALALSGANRYFADHDKSVLLTIPEILALPLQHLRFVVLAACDSGSGPLVPGEGVFGLRRAFRLAGAQAVVMSLWQVDDASSVAWMSYFYAALTQSHSLAQAVSEASRQTLAQRKARGETLHPYYWAAYVASGAMP